MQKTILLIIPIKGFIASGEFSSVRPIPLLPFGVGNATFSEDVVKFLKKIETNKNIKAIIFEIDSPGGTPYASKEIADAIKNLKILTIALIKEYGTSGAYWIASSCNKIVADPLSSIGGIGTRAERLDFSELAKKIGVKVDTFFKGEYKGMGSPYSEPSEKEKNFIKEQVSAFNEYFVEEIKNNRNITDDKILENITSGRPYLGKEALQLNLIDYLGNEETAVKIAADITGIKLKKVYSRIGKIKEPLMARLLKRLF